MCCFRIRFFLTGTSRINLTEAEVVLSAPPTSPDRVALFGYGRPPVSIATTNHLVVEGAAYASLEDARDAGERWRGILERALAAGNLGADFGDTGPTSVLTDAGAELLSRQTGERVVNDVHGVATFEGEPRPLFVSGSATATVGQSGDRVLRLIAHADDSGRRFDNRQRVAYNLFSASIGLEPADARFVMLMMAVETMIEPEPRPAASRTLVEELIADTNGAGLDSAERASITGTLRWLFDESISQAGRRLARTLGEQTYAGRTPPKFFTDCYSVRSNLVHGHVPRPTFETINGLVPELERFTRDLLVGDLIAVVDESEQRRAR